ncbi:MAG: methionyl-tRNA formyltransferase [Desulfobulbaceae bacterium A2]|nr:MAG: methionyl-tRNA formyltransferase [Desulfobulbaceae bacterium A2]
MTERCFRLVFMGTPDFAVPVLQALLEGPDQVVAVVTRPDRPQGRGLTLTAPPVKSLALTAGVPLLQPEAIKTSAYREQLQRFAPDLFIVAAYGRILPGSLVWLPPLGTINVHGSLLPKYRGAAPIQRALMAGEHETGVTIMQMDEGMDTGDMLLKATLPIAQDETAGSLFERVARLGAATLRQALDLLRRGELQAEPQDGTLATLAPPLGKEEGHLDWGLPPSVLHCRIRGLDPWPSAYSFLAGRRLRLFAPELATPPRAAAPGTILSADPRGLTVATGGGGALRLREIQPEGRKRLPVQTYLPGGLLKPGDLLT